MRTDSILREDSIYLRCLTGSDASPHYISWLADTDVTSFLELRFAKPNSLNQLKTFIEQTLTSSDSLLFGIFLNSDSRHIGNIKLGPIDWNHETADIGLLIGDREEWGKGHATAAIRMLCSYAFEDLRLAKLTAGCYAENKGSLNAFLKVGFKQEGIKVSQWKVGKGRQDGIVLGKVNPELYSQLIPE